MLRQLGSAILLWLVLAAAPSDAAPAPDPAGRWAHHAGGRTLLILDLRRGREGRWRGHLERPDRARLTDRGFTEIRGPIVRRSIKEGRATPEGLKLLAHGSAPGDTDAYVFRVSEEGYAELVLEGLPMRPLLFVRAAADERVAESWRPERLYAQDWDYPANEEMARIFEADQAPRTAGDKIDWAKVGAEDDKRRARTKALLDAGKLRNGDDFYRAAFVFQHGGRPDDYLIAHVLATIAVARGRTDATWIAAATLDRYLQAIGRKQVFGTQFTTRPGEAVTQEPYDRALISDALRAALGVPSQADQEKRRAEMDAPRLTR